MKNQTLKKLNRKLLTASILSAALFSQPQAAPLPNGTLLGIEQGVGSSTNVPCASGSCFGMEVAPGLVIWTDFGPGTDGGIVVGKSQASGYQEASSSTINITPGEITKAWFFFSNPGTFYTPSGATENIFGDTSCSGTTCLGVTQLGSWNVAWNGNSTLMGSANGCNSSVCSPEELAGDHIFNYTIVGSGLPWSIHYHNVVPNGDSSSFGNVKFQLLIRGTISPNLHQVASFSVPTEIFVNQPAQFTDTSVFADSSFSWIWRFGDGSTSTTQNPVHTYSQTGPYTVSLSVKDAQGSVETARQEIVVEPAVRFTVPTKIIVNLPVQFTDISVVTGAIVTWIWDFGDGNISSEQNPVNTYTQGGNYTVVLTVENDQGYVETGIQTVRVEPVSLELSSLDGKNGFKLNGEAPGDWAGYGVSAAGDINGDGIDDIIIGAIVADPNGNDSGASYVVFGSTQSFSSQFELSSLDGTNGFKLNGEASGDESGRSVSAAGDINGDGVDDLIIGARFADPNGSDSGASYVVFGNTQGFSAQVELSSLDGTNGFKLNGEALDDWSGYSASAAGDINGDGLDDLIIGAWRADSNGSDSGASYVVFGNTQGFAPQFELSSLDGQNGFRINGEAARDHSGRSVSAAGDINGDGLDDLIIGAPGANPNSTFSGASYVVFGNTQGFAAQFELSSLDGANGFKINGEISLDVSGRSVSGTGDINGDRLDDLIIGAYSADTKNGKSSGASYVVFGSTQRFAAQFELSDLNGANGFKMNGEAPYDYLGLSVSAAGDINGDGINDLTTGAINADPNGTWSGASYVVFGSPQGFSAQVDLSSLDGTNGFRLNGESFEDNAGRGVSAAGDINGDGLDDLIIGALGPNNNAGASYVVFGSTQIVPIPTPTPIPTTCEALYPQTKVTMIGKGKNLEVEETMTTTFKGHIVSTDEAKGKVTICRGSTVSYEVVSTVGTAKCMVKHGVSAEATGTLTDKGKLVCTNKPDGKDTDKFKIKRSKKKDVAVERRWFR